MRVNTNPRMKMQPMAIVVAVDEKGGFGKGGKIPWNFPEDLNHFKEITKDGVCLMGRKTYEDMLEMRKERDKNRKKSVIKHILPGREAYVVTRDPNYNAPGATVVSGIREGVQSLVRGDRRTVFVIGGHRMFIEALAWTDVIHMTIIKSTYDCDRFFPIHILNKGYRIIDGSDTDEMSFVTYRRKA